MAGVPRSVANNVATQRRKKLKKAIDSAQGICTVDCDRKVDSVQIERYHRTGKDNKKRNNTNQKNPERKYTSIVQCYRCQRWCNLTRDSKISIQRKKSKWLKESVSELVEGKANISNKQPEQYVKGDCFDTLNAEKTKNDHPLILDSKINNDIVVSITDLRIYVDSEI
jgi:hypothetical protein